MKTSPLEIGCSVTGINTKKATKTQIKELRDLLYKNRLVVLKDQDLSEVEYCEFSKRFGEPVPYLQENYHHPDFPLIFVSSNVKKDGKQIGVARTGGYWHSDTAFETDPKFITMLMPKVLPQVARSTRFIDMAEVYAALPQTTKDRLKGAQFLHSGRWRFKIRPDCIGLDIHEILQLIDQATPPVTHPGVIYAPLHGRKGDLRQPRLHHRYQGSLPGRVRPRYWREIFDLAESERFVREVQWSMGDIIIWDNRFMQHSSGRNPGPEEETMMYRITLKDGMPLCASQTVPAETAA